MIWFILLLLISQKLHSRHIAYVITTKFNLSENVIKAASACGFSPFLVTAVKPYGEIYDWDRENIYFTCVKNLTGLYLRPKTTLPERCLVCSHKKVYDIIARDTTINDNDWAIIFEDDAGLHPKITPAVMKESLKQAMRISQSLHPNSSEGFIFFGLGSASCDKERVIPVNHHQKEIIIGKTPLRVNNNNV